MYNVDNIVFGCPIEALANILGKKWVAEIIWKMQDQKIRFGELQRLVEGCSKKMLTQQLEQLMEKEIILKEKKTNNNIVESTYYLSEAGLSLLPIMDKMIQWSNNNISCDG